MFDSAAFITQVDSLIRDGETTQAEERMLAAYSDLRSVDNVKDLELVTAQLAHFYSMPQTEDRVKAEAYFIEREALAPSGYAMLQTATFYFYVAKELSKTVKKVDEIEALPGTRDMGSYYSALALKGEALIELGRVDDAKSVLREMSYIVKTNPQQVPFGDEINLLEAAIRQETLAHPARELLQLIVPKIRSQEYRERAEALLKSA